MSNVVIALLLALIFATLAVAIGLFLMLLDDWMYRDDDE